MNPRKQIVLIRSNAVNPDSRVEKEAASLAAAGYEVTILAWDRDANYPEKRVEYTAAQTDLIHIVRVGIKAYYGGGMKKNLLPLLKFQLFIIGYLKRHKDEIDLIHACDFDTALTTCLMARRFHKKFIYDIFDYYVDAFNVPNVLKSMIERMDTHIMNVADATIICTEKRREQIKNATPKRLVVIHNTPNPVEPQTSPFDSQKTKIVYVGILGEKRYLREVAEIVSRNPELELHVGGYGALNEYFIDMAKQYQNILFYGRVPYKTTLELESFCDIMTALYDPSVKNHYYAGPNKFYEALMLGKPLVMIEGTGMSEYVKQYDLGVLAQDSKVSMEFAIQQLAKRKSEWPMMAQRERHLYTSEFSWAVMETRLLNLYKALRD